jgi:serine/threonine protein kinase
VEERKAKEWFRLLLSGVEFLHRRGVVHNDIKYDFFCLFDACLTLDTGLRTSFCPTGVCPYSSISVLLRNTTSSRLKHFTAICRTEPLR